jgi:HlyD family secretion protein
MKRTSLALTTLVVVATASVGAHYSRRTNTGPVLTTEPATRGTIVSVVTATGTLQPVTTVQVGSQVSGIVESLKADFNQIVRKGQVLATLDQSLYASALQQARAALASAQADADGFRVSQAAADVTLARTRELAARQLVPASDLETDESAARSAAAQVGGADAKVLQAQSTVRTAEVNLAQTVIVSPIDGIVTERSVDVGQTVSASMSAPTLFVLAADLSKMQLSASVDESDVGQVRPGQPVTFRVDAYPSETFVGTVSQVRLDATVVSDVVTYAAIIDAPNAAMKLKPGMTAVASIEIARHDDVLRVPSEALRFKPDAEALARFGVKGAAAPTAKASTVWISNGTSISPVVVKTGEHDLSRTEILGAPFAEDTAVVTRVAATAEAANVRPAVNSMGNPLVR